MSKVQSLNEDGYIDNATIIRSIVIVCCLLFFFLIGVKSLSTGLKMLGGDFAKTLFNLSSFPFVSLMAGMLATVLFQSSSVTTSIIVGLVSSGTLSITGAVPMIMGANLGTSVTNTLVSLGYMKNKLNFKRAFAAATVHDFFNILSVLVLLPLELFTGIIQKSATAMASFMYGSVSGVKYSSPIKAMIKPPVKVIKGFSIETFGADFAGIAMIILSAVIIIASLSFIVKTMKVIIESNKSELIDNMLSKNAYAAIAFGTLITISVQSSSITTSLLIPLAGSGVLSLSTLYPITIGANIGTTATALLAALTGNLSGLAIALVHLFFNLLGTLLFFPNKKLREIPIKCSQKLAEYAEKSKVYAFSYVGLVFFLIPLAMIYIFR